MLKEREPRLLRPFEVSLGAVVSDLNSEQMGLLLEGDQCQLPLLHYLLEEDDLALGVLHFQERSGVLLSIPLFPLFSG